MIGLLFCAVLFRGDPFITIAFFVALGLLVGDLLWVATVTRSPTRWFRLSGSDGPLPISETLASGESVSHHIALEKKARGKVSLSVKENEFLHISPSEIGRSEAEKKIVVDFVTPFAGSYRSDKLTVNVLGPLGLFEGRCAVPFESEFRVYPKLASVALATLSLLGRTGIGESPIDKPGVGTEFYDIRKYNPGDDYRQINWKATARMSDLIVNEKLREIGTSFYIIFEAYSPDYFDCDRLATAFLGIANQLTSLQIRFGFVVCDGSGKVIAQRDVASPIENLSYALIYALQFASFSDQEFEKFLSEKNELTAISSYRLMASADKLRRQGFEAIANLQSFGGLELQSEVRGGELLTLFGRGTSSELPDIIYISGMFGDSNNRIVEIATQARTTHDVEFFLVNPTAPWVVSRTEEEGYDEYISYLRKLKMLRYANVPYETGDPLTVLSKLLGT